MLSHARLTYKSGGHGSQLLVRGFWTTESVFCHFPLVRGAWRMPPGPTQSPRGRLLLGVTYGVSGSITVKKEPKQLELRVGVDRDRAGSGTSHRMPKSPAPHARPPPSVRLCAGFEAVGIIPDPVPRVGAHALEPQLGRPAKLLCRVRRVRVHHRHVTGPPRRDLIRQLAPAGLSTRGRAGDESNGQ